MSNKPNIIISPDAQADFAFNGSELETLTNDFGITSTPTILLDNKNRLTVKGVTYPKLLGRMRFFYDKDLRQAEGPIVRVSTRLRGQQRSQAALNKTFAHEMEHVAQISTLR